MSASFSLASADITKFDAEGNETERLEGVQITCRSGKVTLTTDRGAAIEGGLRDGVILSRRVSRLLWEVTFADHTMWRVERSKKGCRTCS